LRAAFEEHYREDHGNRLNQLMYAKRKHS
jgi:hypothetical protein